LNQLWKRRRPILLAVLAALILGISGCGGAQATSWTGLTVVEEILYAADLQQIRVFDTTEEHNPLWAFPDNPEEDNRGLFYIAPTVSDEGVVIAASQTPGGGFLSQANNIVWGLDAETGKELWSFDEARGQYIESGAANDGIFVVGNSDGNVYALGVETGDLKWTWETGHRVWAAPIIVENTVYIGSMDRHLYALDLSNGDLRWDFVADGAFAGKPVLRDGTLYIGAFDNHLYAIDANAGNELWRFPGENWFWGSPVVHGDTVYAVDVDGNVYAVDATSGRQIWHHPLEDPVRAGPALTEDGAQLLVSSQEGTLYALETANEGAEKWSEESEGQRLVTPVVSGTTVYETLYNGPRRIQALHVDNGYEIWLYPSEVEE